mgnify:CR=1 FL=1
MSRVSTVDPTPTQFGRRISLPTHFYEPTNNTLHESTETLASKASTHRGIGVVKLVGDTGFAKHVEVGGLQGFLGPGLRLRDIWFFFVESFCANAFRHRIAALEDGIHKHLLFVGQFQSPRQIHHEALGFEYVYRPQWVHTLSVVVSSISVFGKAP